MAYTITSVNGNIVIQEKTMDTTTSLELVGKNYSEWGESNAQNYVDLLENFAGGTAPARARRGQLWYDITGDGTLKVHDGTDFVGLNADPVLTTAVGADVIGSGPLSSPVTLSLRTVLNDVYPTGDAANAVDAPGWYTAPAINVDAKGRIINITNQGGDGAGPAAYVSYVKTSNTTPKSGVVTIDSAMIIDALGFEPYPASNPDGYGPTGTAPNLSGYLQKSGGTMSGNLIMASNRITGLPTPIDASEPVRKDAFDALSNNKTQRVFNASPSSSYNVTVSSAAPSGGQEGDVWYRY